MTVKTLGNRQEERDPVVYIGLEYREHEGRVAVVAISDSNPGLYLDILSIGDDGIRLAGNSCETGLPCGLFDEVLVTDSRGHELNPDNQ